MGRSRQFITINDIGGGVDIAAQVCGASVAYPQSAQGFGTKRHLTK
jgi:hypothetical protein